MIHLNHIELTDSNGVPAYGEDGTLLRYWQAEVPETDLFAMTEEACTRMGDGDEEKRHARLTRFFVGTKASTGHGTPFGDILVQDELHHGDHFTGPIGPAIREINEPTSWTDAPRQRMLEEAIERHTKQNA